MQKITVMLIRKIVLLILILITCMACNKVSEEQIQNTFDYVPEKTSLIIESADFSAMGDMMQNNVIFNDINQEQHELLKRINRLVNYIPNSSGLLNFSQLGNKNYFLTFIENKNTTQFQLEKSSIQDSVIYEQKKIYKLNLEDELYYTQLSNLNIFSESKLIIENSIRNYTYGIEQGIDFNKLRKTVSNNSASVYFNSDHLINLVALGFHPKKFPIFQNLFGWSAFDLKFSEEQIRLSGVYPFTPESQHKIHLLTNQKAFETTMARFVPMSAIGVETYGINDLKNYFKNKKQLRLAVQEEEYPVLEQIVEIGKIHWKNHDALFFQSQNPRETFNLINKNQEVEKNFRNQKIYKTDFKANVFSIYTPLIAFAHPTYFTQLDNYFIVSESIDHLEDIIISYQNETSLGYEEAYQKTISAMSNKQHALFVGINKNLSQHLSQYLKPKAKLLTSELDFEQFEVSIFQLHMKENFAYLNFEMQQPSTTSNQQKAYLKKRIKLSNKILSPPQYFTNWRTSKKEIVLQDEKYNLQLIDVDGELLWSKQLEEQILGEIDEIDIYKNTRIQLLVSTTSQLLLIDKNGNEVKPFPYKWKESTTQKTAVFDYDNLGKYRFFTVFGNKVNLKDRNNKNISGFNFKPTKSNIASPPKHFRIGNKDYILLKELNNQLHILDRTGTPRVEFTTDSEFSNQEWYLYDNQFTSTTNKGELVQINEKGDVTISNPKFDTAHQINALNKIFVAISENELHINEVVKKLDYGLYTQPQIFEIGEDIFVSVTDQQANKVYVFNEHGELLSGFPIFGSSKIDLFKDANQKLNILVKGEENAILIYEY